MMTNAERLYVCLNAIFEETAMNTNDSFIIIKEVRKTFDTMMHARRFRENVLKERMSYKTYKNLLVLMQNCYLMAKDTVIDYEEEGRMEETEDCERYIRYSLNSAHDMVEYYKRKVLWLKESRNRVHRK